MKRTKLFSYLTAALIATVLITSCSEDEPAALPTIEVTTEGLVEGTITATLGDDVVITIATVADGGFASLTITEYQGLTEIRSEVFETEQTSFTHKVIAADATEPFRVNFLITDNEGQTASADVIIAGELTNIYKLQNFNWQWSGQAIPDGESTMNDCAMDNVYTFNEDGTSSINYGAENPQGSPCELETLVRAIGYTYDDEEKVLTVQQEILDFAIFDWVEHTPKVFSNVTFDGLEFTGTVDYDFGSLGVLTLDETYTAVERAE